MPTRMTDAEAETFRKDHYTVFQGVLAQIDPSTDLSHLVAFSDFINYSELGSNRRGARPALIGLTWNAHTWITDMRTPFAVAECWALIKTELAALVERAIQAEIMPLTKRLVEIEQATAALHELRTVRSWPDYVKAMNYPSISKRFENLTLILCCATVLRVLVQMHGPDPMNQWLLMTNVLDRTLTAT